MSRIEEDVYLTDWETCEYCKTTHYESDTGYRECGCELLGDPYKYYCAPDVCPLDCKVKVEFDDE